jgi:hypothetical protein
MDAWVNGEPIRNQDMVIWCDAHFTHDFQNEPPGPPFGHMVGPDLRPFKW